MSWTQQDCKPSNSGMRKPSPLTLHTQTYTSHCLCQQHCFCAEESQTHVPTVPAVDYRLKTTVWDQSLWLWNKISAVVSRTCLPLRGILVPTANDQVHNAILCPFYLGLHSSRTWDVPVQRLGINISREIAQNSTKNKAVYSPSNVGNNKKPHNLPTYALKQGSTLLWAFARYKFHCIQWKV